MNSYRYHKHITGVDLHIPKIHAPSHEPGGLDPITKLASLDYLDFNLNPTLTHQEGRMHWNGEDGTLELGMPGGNVELQVGQEQLLRAVNKETSTILNGQVVYISGAQGSKPTILLADNSDSNKINISGIATENIDANQSGYINIFGYIRDLDTTGVSGEVWVTGDNLYLGTSGDLSNTHPNSATEATIVVAIVTRVHSNEGSIFFNGSRNFTLGNDFNGTLRQSVINTNSGTSAAVGFTAVNDLNHWVTFGMACSGNTVFPNEVAILYSPGYGDFWQAVDGNKDFVWYTDPTDSHNNSSLSYERMRLKADGRLGIGIALPTSTLDVNGNRTMKVSSKTADYTASDEEVITVDATSGAVTITLPAISGITGRTYSIKCINADNTVTVDCNASETIDGSTTQILGLYDCLKIVATATEWSVI